MPALYVYLNCIRHAPGFAGLFLQIVAVLGSLSLQRLGILCVQHDVNSIVFHSEKNELSLLAKHQSVLVVLPAAQFYAVTSEFPLS